MNFSKLSGRSVAVIVAVVLIVGAGVARYISVRKSRPPFELTDMDKKQIKTDLEKIVRDDLASRKATKVNAVTIADPEISDMNHMLISYEFSYEEAGKSGDDGQVSHDMKAVAHLERIPEGWQIGNVTSGDEDLKFATPLVIQTAPKNAPSHE